jgi:hypothetical protein
MGFNSVFKGLILRVFLGVQFLNTRGLTDKQTNTADFDVRSAERWRMLKM